MRNRARNSSRVLMPPAYSMNEALERLETNIRDLGSALIAFSGGVDSAVVSAVAMRTLGARALAVTAVSPSLPATEREGAVRTARAIGIAHELAETREVEDPRYAANPANRCFYCKSELYAVLTRRARELGFEHVIDGFNRDDQLDVRPGRGAALKLGVRSPLDEAGLGKAEVRELARLLDLEVWDKPAMACLSSRVPTGTRIDSALLAQIERAESALISHGLRECRVRHHGTIARIEVAPPEMSFFSDDHRRAQIVESLRKLGYEHVTLDLAGYTRPLVSLL